MTQMKAKEKHINERKSVKISALLDFKHKKVDYYSWLSEFRCAKAEPLQKYLVEDAIREDVHHKVKTFIIYDEAVHMVVGYFSIRSTCIIRKLIDTIENEKIVSSIIPCIELTKFCVNDKYLLFLKENKYKNKGIGEYLFYTFVVPSIVVLSGMVGFTELILFALQDENEKVIEAYHHMGFETIEDDHTKIISTLEGTSLIVDEYSCECKFMYQDIEEIIRKYVEGNGYA